MNAITQKYDSNIEVAKDDTTPAIQGQPCKYSDSEGPRDFGLA
jgi:hypothetical protein